MTETAVPRLVCTLAVPTIISMLVSSLYNMADTYFVSQLGTSAAGAVGVVFSVMAIIQAVGFTFFKQVFKQGSCRLSRRQRNCVLAMSAKGREQRETGRNLKFPLCVVL